MIKKLHEHLHSKSRFYKDLHSHDGQFSAAGTVGILAIALAFSVGASMVVAEFNRSQILATAADSNVATAGGPVHLFDGVNAGEAGITKALEAHQKDKTVKRTRVTPVKVDTLNPRNSGGTSSIVIELFDGQTVTVDKTKVESRSSSNYTWYGKTKDPYRGYAMFTVVDGYLTGVLNITDTKSGISGTYDLQYVSDNMYVLREHDYSLIAEEPDTLPVAPRDSGTQVATDASMAATADSGDGIIDVMIVYTNQSAAALGASMESFAQSAIDSANMVYANSGLSYRLRLAYVGHANYNEIDDYTDHSNVTSGAGTLSVVHDWRNIYRADIVSLFRSGGSYCGVGWVGPQDAYAYNVVHYGCAVGNLSFTHELGHNMGLQHNPETDPSEWPYVYGHGYVDPACQFRTVMAYDICGAPRVAYHSNPRMVYPGTNSPLGTTELSDAVRALTQTMPVTSNFRTTASTNCSRSNPVVTISPSSANGSAGQSLTYTVSVTNKDASSCTGSEFSVTPTLPSGFIQTPASLTYTLQPGAGSGQSVVITSPTTAGPGGYSIVQTASNISQNGGYVGTGNATYSVVIPDTVLPTVSITSPVNGYTLPTKGNTSVTIQASASDASGIRRIDLYVNNNIMKTCNQATSCSYKWNSSKAVRGVYTIKAVAVDNSTNQNQSNTSVTVTKP